jgi:hypothetical protein
LHAPRATAARSACEPEGATGLAAEHPLVAHRDDQQPPVPESGAFQERELLEHDGGLTSHDWSVAPISRAVVNFRHGAPRTHGIMRIGEQDGAMASRSRSVNARPLLLWRGLSALLLLAMGGIHLYLVFHGTGGILGILFVLNAVGGLVLAIAMVVARGWLLPVASVLSLLFMAGTLLALVLALTVGLFGIRSSLDYDLAPTTLVVESIGTLVLAVTTVLVLRAWRGATG